MNSIDTVPALCPICGKPPSRSHARGRDFEYQTTGETEWTVKECEACEVLALSPRPSEAALRQRMRIRTAPVHQTLVSVRRSVDRYHRPTDRTPGVWSQARPEANMASADPDFLNFTGKAHGR